MVAVSKRRYWFSERLIPMSPEDAGTRKIVCYRRIRISGGEPEIIGNSRLSNTMPTKQVDIVILFLSDLALLAWRRDYGGQLTGITLPVERVIVRVVLVTHPEQNVGVTDCLRCLEGKYIAFLIEITKGRNEFASG